MVNDTTCRHVAIVRKPPVTLTVKQCILCRTACRIYSHAIEPVALCRNLRVNRLSYAVAFNCLQLQAVQLQRENVAVFGSARLEQPQHPRKIVPACRVAILRTLPLGHQPLNLRVHLGQTRAGLEIEHRHIIEMFTNCPRNQRKVARQIAGRTQHCVPVLTL